MLPRAVCLYVEYYPIGFNKGQFELPKLNPVSDRTCLFHGRSVHGDE
jgi:hypothetical protein